MPNQPYDKYSTAGIYNLIKPRHNGLLLTDTTVGGKLVVKETLTIEGSIKKTNPVQEIVLADTTIVAAANPAAGVALTLAAQPKGATKLLITCTGDHTTSTYTIVGVDQNGANVTEDVTGANAGTKTTTKYYSKITSITGSKTIAANVAVTLIKEQFVLGDIHANRSVYLSGAGHAAATLTVLSHELGRKYKIIATHANTQFILSSNNNNVNFVGHYHSRDDADAGNDPQVAATKGFTGFIKDTTSKIGPFTTTTKGFKKGSTIELECISKTSATNALYHTVVNNFASAGVVKIDLADNI